MMLLRILQYLHSSRLWFFWLVMCMYFDEMMQWIKIPLDMGSASANASLWLEIPRNRKQMEPGYGDRRVRVRGPGWPDHCVR